MKKKKAKKMAADHKEENDFRNNLVEKALILYSYDTDKAARGWEKTLQDFLTDALRFCEIRRIAFGEVLSNAQHIFQLEKAKKKKEE